MSAEQHPAHCNELLVLIDPPLKVSRETPSHPQGARNDEQQQHGVRSPIYSMSRSQTPSYAVRRPPISVNSTVVAQSRSSTPLARTVISLEDWESKSPLSDEQVQSISQVREKYAQRPLPAKVSPLSRGLPKRVSSSATVGTPRQQTGSWQVVRITC